MAAGQGRRAGFVTGGCWCLDRNKVVDQWPEEDQTVTVRSTRLSGGGSACNFALVLRRLDPQVSIETIGVVGDDDAGAFLRDVAGQNRIDHTQLHVARGVGTHATDAYSSLASGRRTHVFEEGASAVLAPHHFDFEATSGLTLHLGLPGIHQKMDAPYGQDPNGWVSVLRAARAAGLKTNLELVTVARERIAALVQPCLPLLDYLVTNDYEIGALAGFQTTQGGVTDEAACLAAAREVLSRGAMDVVAVHYTAGAFALDRNGIVHRKPSVRVPQSAIRGTNGAGDAFAAGFLLALQDAEPLEDALALAHAVAATCLSDVTPTEGVLSRAEAIAAAQRWGWRAQ